MTMLKYYIKRQIVKAFKNIFIDNDEQIECGYSDFNKLWGEYDISVEDINEVLTKKVVVVFTKNLSEIIDSYVESGEFIDKIIERINRKQINNKS